MEITVSQEQARVPVTVFRITGKIDVTTHEQLEKQARASFDGGTKTLLIDLSQVTYMSSAGLQALYRIFLMLRGSAPGESEEAMRAGIRAGTFKSPHLKLLKPSANVIETLKLVGYDMFIEVHQNYKEALASF